VGLPRNVVIGREELGHEEQRQHHRRRHVDDLEGRSGDHGQHASTRKQHQVGTHGNCDGARRPNQGYGRSGVARDESKGGQDPADQVEAQEVRSSDAPLHVLAEHPQEQHVAGEVEDAPVDEHACEQAEADRLLRREIFADLALAVVGFGDDQLTSGDLASHRAPSIGELIALHDSPLLGLQGVHGANLEPRRLDEQENDHVDGE